MKEVSMDGTTNRRTPGNAHRILVGHTLRKGTFGRSYFGRYNKIYLRNICCKNVNRLLLVQDIVR